jgi:hypothetical protein
MLSIQPSEQFSSDAANGTDVSTTGFFLVVGNIHLWTDDGEKTGLMVIRCERSVKFHLVLFVKKNLRFTRQTLAHRCVFQSLPSVSIRLTKKRFYDKKPVIRFHKTKEKSPVLTDGILL